MPKLEYLNPPKYDQYSKYREYLRKATDFSCAYCTISESESPGATFNIDHFRPQKEFPSLEASCENLRYTCPRCNSYKRNRWIQRTAGCIRDCKTCTTHVCKENIPRFIDTLKELPSEHIFLNEDDRFSGGRHRSRSGSSCGLPRGAYPCRRAHRQQT